MKPNYKIFAPIILAITMVLGVYLGIFLSANSDSRQINLIVPQSKTYAGKLNQILNYIENQYVDSVEKEKLVEKAITSLLAELDPHSSYISNEELTAFTEPLEGNFDGIGVEFLIQNDTVVVVNTIVGGPSESVGVLPGDRLIVVDGKSVAGVGITNEDVMKALKGTSGSKVKVKVLRKSGPKMPEFVITRGKIPLNSVETAFMINDSVGYIKLSRFAKTSHAEFINSINTLYSQPGRFTRLVLDLRGNGGGILGSAIEIAEEFLLKDQLIVYTQGKSQPIRKYYSKRNGRLKDLTLDVLINESSASASEILAGALQDNDRGTIIGRRSFGKGLVQEVMNLPDRSALSLTVARYYTPTGRSIQKPYGEGIDYEGEFQGRMKNGELQFSDSIKYVDSLQFKTAKGKTVYGGGGIVPDVFVGVDSSDFSMLVSTLIYSGVLNQFAFDYVDNARPRLKEYKNVADFQKRFVVTDAMYKELFKSIPDQSADGFRKMANATETKAIKTRVKALIGRNLFGSEAYYRILLPTDDVVQKALAK